MSQNPSQPKSEVSLDEYDVEVKDRITAVRSFRESLYTLVHQQAMAPGRQALLVLTDPGLTPQRLSEEWKIATMVFRPGLLSRIHLVTIVNDQCVGLPKHFTPPMREALLTRVRMEKTACGPGERDRDAFSDILKVLIRLWLMDQGPVTMAHLGALTGFSHPTLSSVLKRLHNRVRRTSDRRVELADFPRDAWAQLVALADRVRPAIRFVDQSGQPRRSDAILRRLNSLALENVGAGGIVGAKHHDPGLDLIGTPRLDLTIHCPQGQPDLDFVRSLDPALKLAPDPSAPVALAVHLDRCPVPSFVRDGHGLLIANPVECLLDLHEARLEDQARQLLDVLVARKRKDC